MLFLVETGKGTGARAILYQQPLLLGAYKRGLASSTAALPPRPYQAPGDKDNSKGSVFSLTSMPSVT